MDIYAVAGDEHNFEKYSHKEADTLGLPYDYSSVMHYTKTSSSKNGMPTMLAIGRKDIQLGNSNTLTSTDILQINRLYECESKFFAFLSAGLVICFSLTHSGIY